MHRINSKKTAPNRFPLSTAQCQWSRQETLDDYDNFAFKVHRTLHPHSGCIKVKEQGLSFVNVWCSDEVMTWHDTVASKAS